MADKTCLVALDVGGTKTHLIVETLAGDRLLDTVITSHDWDAEPAAHGADWLAARLKANLPSDIDIASIAFGAQGINRPDTGRALEAALLDRGYRTHAVNDAALIVPAAGFLEGIGVIAGTGAIAVGTDAGGQPLSAGGWGCVIGDEGGAAALVREAARAALRAHDEGRPDDGLLSALIKDFGVEDAERLTRKVNDDPTAENWAPHCEAVFDAAERGSQLAANVISEGADYLAALVGQLTNRGATGKNVVVAGSVIVNQSRLFDAFKLALYKQHPQLSVHMLTVSPVEGALFLARAALGIAAE
jgi:N-acetylglucosamine kinase-like BadF-type ATPase